MEALSALPLLPGFGFHPTDVELLLHYLKRKILGQKIEFEVIPQVDIYKHEPWDLPEKSWIPTRDCKWHFFTSRDRKYPNGSRSNRATEAGYWKSTGKDRSIRSDKRIIGTKKTLVFHKGKPPSGKRTDWIMHEYYLNENECKAAPSKDIFVLCRITKRNGLTKEDGEIVSTEVEQNISPSASLPTKNCSKELQDVSVHMLPKKEVCSPAENMDDFGALFTEFHDPNFCIDPLSENKVDVPSLAVKHDLGNIFFSPNHIEETNVSVPEKDAFYGGLSYQFNIHEFDNQLFGLSNSEVVDAIYSPQLEPGFGVDYLSYPGYAAECIEEDMVTIFPTSDFALSDSHCRLIPKDGEGQIATFSYDLTGPQGAIVDTGIQIRAQESRPPNEISSHRIRLQVHKMESRNPGPINQTFVFVSQDGHLDSTYELNQDSIPFETKLGPALSRDFTDSHQMGAHLREKLTHGDSALASNPQHVIRSQGRASKNSKSESDFELGSVYAFMVSMLRYSKLVKPRCASKSSLKSHGSASHTGGFLKGIGCFLCKGSLAGLNCLSLFLATCTTGAAALIAFFLVRDVRWSLSGSPTFQL